MALWHRHRWFVKERVVAPPKASPMYNTIVIDAREERLLHGTTTFLLGCDCGAMKTLVCLGLPESTADQLERMVRP